MQAIHELVYALRFFVIGLLLISADSLHDILFGHDLSHPIWDSTFNWYPLLAEMAVVAGAGGAVLAHAARWVPACERRRRHMMSRLRAGWTRVFGTHSRRTATLHAKRNIFVRIEEGS